MNIIIRFEDVYKTFGSNRVLDGLNLDILEGETITVIGGSGTGKSVLLKLLLGVLKPDRGRIYFYNKDITKMDENELIETRRHIGMLFQGAALFDSLTVFENIAYPLREHYKFQEDEIKKTVANCLKHVGLDGLENMMPADLSGGMKKRVGLARAIATKPKVILYDEPTTGLDPANTKRINKLIVDLQNKLKVTSVVVTHDMQSAFQVTNRLAMLNQRKIGFVGTKEEAMSSNDPVVRNFIKGNIGDEESIGF